MKFHDYDIAKNLTKFDENVFIEELMNSVDTFSEPIQLMINEALKYAVNKTDFFHIYEWLQDPIKWRIPKVSLDTFLDHPHYLWTRTNEWRDIFKMTRIFCRNVIEWGYAEAIELAWIGTWKSYWSQIMACYQAHHLLCLRQPHRNYWLSPDKSLVIMNMWPTASQALDIVFAWIKSFIENSPFFLQFWPNIQTTTIKFKEKIDLVSWNSKVTTSIWYNIFAAVLDEAAFYLDNDDKNVAKEIYMSLQSRITSRMNWKWGLLVWISSPRYEWDFITEKVAQAEELNKFWGKKYKNIYAIKLQSWKAKDLPKEDLKDPFYFDPRKCIIIEDTNLDRLKTEWFKVNKITDWVVESDDDVWEIPRYLLEKFQNNPEGAKRDYGAIPSTAISWYFSNPEKISQMFNRDRLDPIISPWRYRFQTRPLRVPYFIHIDIWFNRNKKWDHLWFCMGHFWWWEVDPISKEYRMRYYIDLVERIWITEDTGEVDLSEVRQRIYDLKDMWYFIKLVTFDQFASKDFRQIIEKKGFRTEYVSVDRTTDPYDLVKAAVYEWRIDIYYNETVEKELKWLELIKWNKVDHPSSGSKDLTDALAWVVWDIAENTPKSNTMLRHLSEDDWENNKDTSRYANLKAREQYYERIQKQVAKQHEMEEKIMQMRRNIEAKQALNDLF